MSRRVSPADLIVVYSFCLLIISLSHFRLSIVCFRPFYITRDINALRDNIEVVLRDRYLYANCHLSLLTDILMVGKESGGPKRTVEIKDRDY